MAGDDPCLPDYSDRCVTNVVPTLLYGGAGQASWLDDAAAAARQVVLFVIDGLGWEQLQARPHVAPNLTAMTGGPITTVAPSTTAAALTSITTGAPPGSHGVVGYRIQVDGAVLNALRWSTPAGDARQVIEPSIFQPLEPFLAAPVTVVNKAEFEQSGFTGAHLTGAAWKGYRTPASLVHEVGMALDAGERFVYTYYDALDRIGHEYGHGGHYDAELAFCDRLVGDLVERLPPGAALVVTADHGQVETGDQIVEFHSDVVGLTRTLSGEARLRWLHCHREDADQLLAAAQQHHGHEAWVRSVEQVIDEHWLGPVVGPEARQRLGDVAVAARGSIAFADPDDLGLALIGRHGSLTSAEMFVPLLTATAS